MNFNITSVVVLLMTGLILPIQANASIDTSRCPNRSAWRSSQPASLDLAQQS